MPIPTVEALVRAPSAWTLLGAGRRGRAAGVLPPVFLILGDLLAFGLAEIGLDLVGAGVAESAPLSAVAAFGCVALFATAGVYPGYFLHAHELLRRRCLAGFKLAIGAGGAAMLFGSAQLAVHAAALVLLAFALQMPIGAAVRAGLQRAGVWGRPAWVFAAPGQVALIRSHFRENPRFGLICAESRKDRRLSTLEANETVALVAAPFDDRAELAALRKEFADVILLADLPCLPPTGLRPCDVNGAVGFRLGGAAPALPHGRAQRLIDVPLSLLAIMVATPIMLVSAAAIWVLDPGPVIYRQVREGRGGRTFRILKLRTMYRDADARLESLLQNDPAARAEWMEHFKLRRDPRILPVIGNFLRESSIDELPQFLNVLAGDMSVVGPRPFPLYHLAAIDPAFREARCSVTPGLTGFWQVSERAGATIERQQCLDRFYLENRSFWFDLDIIISTVSAVLGQKGAH